MRTIVTAAQTDIILVIMTKAPEPLHLASCARQMRGRTSISCRSEIHISFPPSFSSSLSLVPLFDVQMCWSMHVDYEAYFVGYIPSTFHYFDMATMIRSQELDTVGCKSLVNAWSLDTPLRQQCSSRTLFHGARAISQAGHATSGEMSSPSVDTRSLSMM